MRRGENNSIGGWRGLEGGGSKRGKALEGKEEED